MDQAIRNRLRNAVTQCRRLLEDAVSQVLQGQFGVYVTGKNAVQVEDASRMGHLSEEDKGYREQILVHFGHVQARGFKPTDALEQLVREVSFTHLNRLCAYKMMEKRGLIREAVSRGLKSQGFLFHLADHPEDEALATGGQQDLAYKHFLQWLGGTLSEEIGVLFSPTDPANRLFPPQRVLDEVLGLLNGEDLKDIWSEDETIGWVYQYFTPKELREQARKESQVPRNSHELAFRNQFFTPRYVVEFLTDNTLGRLWYEMRKGDSRLKDECRYLVRRPTEVFLRWDFGDLVRLPFLDDALRGDFAGLPETPAWDEISPFALLIDGYGESERHGLGECGELANARLGEYRSTGQWRGNALELWCCLFFEQRRWRHFGDDPQGHDLAAILSLYQTLRRELTEPAGDLSQEELLRRPVFVPLRLPKDPREIKVLDPACGSGHFLLYSFALLLIIYEEAWEQGLIDRSEFGVRDAPGVRAETVRLDPDARPTSNYSGESLDPDRAFVVVTATPDGGDGIEANTPYVVGEATTFRVPFRFRVPLKQFDYARALREDWFTAEVGTRFVGQIGCFSFEGIPVRSEEDASKKYRQGIPAMILRHNLHGIDIDPRAAQIAALALWLRAQRAYEDMGIKRGERPRITRTNVVCAEPMPGEEALLDDFLRTLREDRLESLIRRVLKVPEGTRVRATQAMVESLGELVRSVWRNMKLAGEAGSLLKVEEDLQGAIAAGQDEWEEKLPLFRMTRHERDQTVKESYLRFVPGEQDTFWDKAEGLVLAALEDYARHAGSGQGLLRRLFADDAAGGFAFIDLCRQKFDVVLMNPPFGEASKPSKPYIEKAFPRSKNDEYAAFVEQGLDRMQPQGLLGAITSRSGFFVSTFQTWREQVLLKSSSLELFIDLGLGILDAAMVETAAYCLGKSHYDNKTVFVRLLYETDKEKSLMDAKNNIYINNNDSRYFLCNSSSFSLIPGSPFAYWISDRVRGLFKRLPPFESEDRTVRGGLKTGDDFRFVRTWWEVATDKIVSGTSDTNPDQFRQQTKEGKRWVPFAKGGRYSSFHCDLHLVVDWKDDGAQSWEFYRLHHKRVGGVVRNPDVYFLPGLTWAYRTHRLCLQELPSGAIISVRGSGMFATVQTLRSWLSIGNSLAADILVKLSLGRGGHPQFNPGDLQILPFPMVDEETNGNLGKIGLASLSLKKRIRMSCETSHCFTLPEMLRVNGNTLEERHENYKRNLAEIHANLRQNQNEIDSICFRLYEITPEEILASSTLPSELSVRSEEDSQNIEEEPAEADAEAFEGIRNLTACVVSYSIGCLFGRWNIRHATGEIQPPGLPAPFVPLPISSPAYLQESKANPLHYIQGTHPLHIDRDGILVDDIDHSDDLIRCFRDIQELLWQDRADAIEREACERLSVDNLRDYFRKTGKGGFWIDHLSTYTRSQRTSPIYWLLQSSKKNYALWIYYHRLDKDILFKALLNYVEPKVRLEESRLEPLRAQRTDAGTSGKGAKGLEKQIDKQEALLTELRDFEAKLRRAAELHLEPDLDDGVVLNIAPLWEIVPWKEAKLYWEELLAGKYEWSSIGKQLRQRGIVS